MKENSRPTRHGSAARVAIGLGANLDRPEVAIRRALALLRAGGVAALRSAPLYTTRPLDCEAGTPDFLNTVACGSWRGSPLALLTLCQAIERRLGRPAEHSRRAARAIDLDILLFGERRLASARLTIPHPRLRQRLFVLVPLADLEPEWRLPPTLETASVCRDRALQAPGAASWGRPCQTVT
jgi:2-amino-4-hydroxy-6-hydroxymethyldihydropteridine diphosphokinase